MTALAEARFEAQVASAPVPSPPADDDAPPDADGTSADEAAALLPHAVEGDVDTAAKDVSRLRRGFYAYSIASEVFVIVAGTLFLPVVLETYARENGRIAPGYEGACPPSGLGGAGEAEEGDAARCAVRLLGMWIDTASFSLIVYSASVAAQALTVISIGKLADEPHVRHRLLAIFAVVGSLACISFLLVPSASPLWPVSALLALLANVSFGASIVCLNSYLPDLGRLDPSVLRAHASLHTAQRAYLSRRRLSSASSNTLLSSSQSLAHAADAYTTARGRATGALSARAIAAGYAAGIGVLVALLPLVRALSGDSEDGTWPLRVAVALSGAWWLVGTIPAAAWLRPLERTTERYGRKGRGLRVGVRDGWIGLAEMLREWRRLPQTFVFLAAWFILSDSFATITSTAILFAKTVLGLPTSSLILIAILTPLCGLLGALLCPVLQAHPSLAHLRLTNHRLLLALVLLSLLVPIWGLLALRTPGQMYALSCVFGALFGAFQAFSRATYAALIPPARGARFYALYSITDKSSSFLGPLLVALVTNATGELRHGFWLIAGLMAAAVPVLAAVDTAKGAEDAERMDRELKVEEEA
ncbi:Autophagy protein 22 [Rhodotorula kratochvilovae]